MLSTKIVKISINVSVLFSFTIACSVYYKDCVARNSTWRFKFVSYDYKFNPAKHQTIRVGVIHFFSFTSGDASTFKSHVDSLHLSCHWRPFPFCPVHFFFFPSCTRCARSQMLPTLSGAFSFLKVTFEKRFFQSETANGYGFCSSPSRFFFYL